MNLLKEQLWIEEEGHLEAKAKYLRQVGHEGEGLLNTMGESIVAICAPVLADLYKKWRDETLPGKAGNKKKWFRTLEVDSLGVALVTLRTILQKTTYGSTGASPSVTSVAIAIYKAVHIEDSYQKVRKASKGKMVAGKESSAKKSFNKNFDAELAKHVSFVKRKRLIDHARETYVNFEEIEAENKFLAGMCLLDLSMKMMAPLSRDRSKLFPLFVVEQDAKSRKKLVMSEALSSYLLKYKQFKAGNAVNLKPMVVPPLPWSGIFGGGYRTLKCQMKLPLIRTDKTRVYKDSDFSPLIYKACNVIQATPWSINKKVYTIMRYCYDNELSIAELPVNLQELRLPPSLPEDEWEALTKTERTNYMSKRKAIREFIDSQRSKVIAFGSKMSMCMKFIKYDKLYFPHSFDFRGRIYPVNTPVNPQADKFGQALLHFHNKKRLGESGVKWWKVHGANCWGIDKAPYEERVQWIDDNHDFIIRCAKEPLKLHEEWAKADDPWNFLAFAFEYASAHSKGIPEEDYESSLPVKLDATSSGLQHYSAIFRDAEGALATNLTKDKQRMDIYGLVAKEAKLAGVLDLDTGGLERDDGVDVGIARNLLGRLSRGHTKPATMCLPYGITEYGAITDTIELADAGDYGKFLRDADAVTTYRYCAWITRHILAGVSKVVTSAVVGMDWLKSAEKSIQKVNKNHEYIKYFTRLGFPSQQTYNKSYTKRVNTFLGKTRCQINVSKPMREVDKRKSQSSIAPNYVHSMDATHLLMTALKSAEVLGIQDFSFIHDSFGVHACDTEAFSRVIRETFVTLYSTDVLTDLRNQWLTQFPTAEIPPVPKEHYGDFNLDEVKESRYFFS
jgi:DNA-directed RNA polymerase